MQNLISELTQPRPPSAASLRAAKALQELKTLHQQDLQGRLIAEQKLAEAYQEIERLRNEKINSNKPFDTTTGLQDGNPVVKPNGNEMPN